MPHKSDALIESKSLRESVINRVDVLEKVKKLAMLPDDVYSTIELVAEYFDVSIETIKTVIKCNKDELYLDGLRVLRKNELRSLKDLSVIPKNVPMLTVIPRRAILRIGMLLRDSEVAKTVRTYLIDVEEEVRVVAPHITTRVVNQFSWRRVKANIKAKSDLYKLIGLPESSALAHAISHEERETGLDLTEFKRLVRDEDTDATYTPTEIGTMLSPPLSAVKVNKLLEQLGLQIKNIKNEWELTEKGKKFAKLSRTVIRHGNKSKEDSEIEREKMAIRWKDTVVSMLQEVHARAQKENLS